MTRKDFIIIAEIIRNMPTHSASLRTAQASCASAFADGLGKTNAAFNRELFIQAATGVVALNARKAS